MDHGIIWVFACWNSNNTLPKEKESVIERILFSKTINRLNWKKMLNAILFALFAVADARYMELVFDSVHCACSPYNVSCTYQLAEFSHCVPVSSKSIIWDLEAGISFNYTDRCVQHKINHFIEVTLHNDRLNWGLDFWYTVSDMIQRKRPFEENRQSLDFDIGHVGFAIIVLFFVGVVRECFQGNDIVK